MDHNMQVDQSGHMKDTDPMDHAMHPGHGNPKGGSLSRVALMATLHCLTGCAIGEVLGMVIGTALGWGNGSTLLLAIVLAFGFGYALTMRPLLAAGIPMRRALRLALAADTISIAIMEVVDNGIMLLVPGAMDAPLTSGLFWGALGVALLLAGAAAFPANLWLIARGRGHAVVHGAHVAPAGGGPPAGAARGEQSGHTH